MFDPGLGKTSVTLAALKLCDNNGTFTSALVIAPLQVCLNVWPDEVEKWSDFSGFKVHVLHGKTRHKYRELDYQKALAIINPEGLTAVLKEDPDWISRVGFSHLVVDELSRYKHAGTQRFKLLKNQLGNFKYRWGLTGSPAANNLEGLFGQTFVLDRGATFGPYITHFRRAFCDQHPSGFGWVVREHAKQVIYEKLKPTYLRAAAEDHLDMPETIVSNRVVHLPVAARKLYEQVNAVMLAELEGGLINAGNAAAKTTKLRQMASGAVYVSSDILLPDEEGKWSLVHAAKLDALESLVEELQGRPLLVGIEYRHEATRIKERFPHAEVLSSELSAQRSKSLIARWNAGDVPLLVGHPASMGHGLNLQGCCAHVCWFTPTWNYEYYDQFNRRVLRQGNKNRHVFIYHLVSRGTIDEKVLKALSTKRSEQGALFDALKGE